MTATRTRRRARCCARTRSASAPDCATSIRATSPARSAIGRGRIARTCDARRHRPHRLPRDVVPPRSTASARMRDGDSRACGMASAAVGRSGIPRPVVDARRAHARYVSPPSMADFIRCRHRSESPTPCRPREARRRRRANDRALPHAPRGFFATDNTCPHRGGPLAEGDVIGNEIVCPWHLWGFDVATGRCAGNADSPCHARSSHRRRSHSGEAARESEAATSRRSLLQRRPAGGALPRAAGSRPASPWSAIRIRSAAARCTTRSSFAPRADSRRRTSPRCASTSAASARAAASTTKAKGSRQTSWPPSTGSCASIPARSSSSAASRSARGSPRASPARCRTSTRSSSSARR